MRKVPVRCGSCDRRRTGWTFIYPDRAVLMVVCKECDELNLEELPELETK